MITTEELERTRRSLRVVWWAYISAAFGSSALLSLLTLSNSIPSDSDYLVYTWPFYGLVAGVILIGLAAVAHRRAPVRNPVSWKFRLSDLLSALLFAAVLAAVATMQVGLSGRIAAGLIPIGAALYIEGVMAASWNGFYQEPWRIWYVLAHVCFSAGCSGLCALVVVLITVFLQQRRPDFAGYVYELLLAPTPSGFTLALLLRPCVYLFPIGVIAIVLLRREPKAPEE